MKWFSLLLLCALAPAQLFKATPITDFQSGETYQGHAPVWPSSSHDTDGHNIGQSIQPLDTNGNPSPDGVIVVSSAGHSIPERETCGDQINGGKCFVGSFMSALKANPAVNPKLVMINGAEEGAGMFEWAYSGSNVFSRIKKLLATQGLTPAQVQVIFWDGVENQPQAGAYCRCPLI